MTTDIRRVGMVSPDTTGAGSAAVFASSRFDVVGIEPDAAALDQLRRG